MKNDLIICAILIGLFIATLLLAGQKTAALDSINTRLALIEDTLQDRNIPRITVSKGTIYAGSGSITIDDLKDGEE